jgi:hypothetical protein
MVVFPRAYPFFADTEQVNLRSCCDLMQPNMEAFHEVLEDKDSNIQYGQI